MPTDKLDFQRKCKVCGGMFTPKTITSISCSSRCQKIVSKRKKEEERRKEEMVQVIEQIPEAEDLISVNEAVVLLGISRDTIYRLIRKGTIPSINIGELLTLINKEKMVKMLL